MNCNEDTPSTCTPRALHTHCVYTAYVPCVCAACVRGVREAYTRHRWRLTVLSEQEVVLDRVPAGCTRLKQGRWQGGSAGGSHLEAAWGRNPQFGLIFGGGGGGTSVESDGGGSGTVQLRVVLSRPSAARAKAMLIEARAKVIPVEAMLGMYVAAHARPMHRVYAAHTPRMHRM